jgi:hypothetical protein
MSQRHVKVGAVLAAVVASFVALPTGTASADVCDDGWLIWNAYVEMGDTATAFAMLDTLADMDCY